MGTVDLITTNDSGACIRILAMHSSTILVSKLLRESSKLVGTAIIVISASCNALATSLNEIIFNFFV